jgi:hypothetical protein
MTPDVTPVAADTAGLTPVRSLRLESFYDWMAHSQVVSCDQPGWLAPPNAPPKHTPPGQAGLAPLPPAAVPLPSAHVQRRLRSSSQPSGW